MVKGGFFDLFGTLMMYTDMQTAWEKWLQALYEDFKDCGLDMPQKSFASKCDGFLARKDPVIKNHKLTIYEKRIYSLGLELNLQLEIEIIRKIVNNTINAWIKYVPLNPQIIELNIIRIRLHLVLNLVENLRFLTSILVKK